MRKRFFVLTLVLVLFSITYSEAQKGWYPHEGTLMKYRVDIRFGEEPEDTMPEGWKFGRVSGVATDSRGQVFVFQRGPRPIPLSFLTPRGDTCAPGVEECLEDPMECASTATTTSGSQTT